MDTDGRTFPKASSKLCLLTLMSAAEPDECVWPVWSIEANRMDMHECNWLVSLQLWIVFYFLVAQQSLAVLKRKQRRNYHSTCVSSSFYWFLRVHKSLKIIFSENPRRSRLHLVGQLIVVIWVGIWTIWKFDILYTVFSCICYCRVNIKALWGDCCCDLV